MRRKLKLIVIDSDFQHSRGTVIKRNISSEREAIETFREILQSYYGIPDEEILKRFKMPVGYKDGR